MTARRLWIFVTGIWLATAVQAALAGQPIPAVVSACACVTSAAAAFVVGRRS